MIEISPEIATFIMLGGVLIGVLVGYPLALPIGALGLIMGILVIGPNATFDLYYTRVFSIITNYILLAIPLFVFMGSMLERSGIASGLYDALYLWMGGLRGGLALVTVLVGTIMAACVGIIAASVTMLALVGMPSMVKRGYDKALASGAVCAGGTLGILIPPSIMLVIYGPMSGLSVGKLFMGAFMPGFLLSFLYITYIAIRCQLQPEVGPPVPLEERQVPLAKKTIMLLTSLIPPALLVISVLGVIYLGIAAPTEAAGIGASAATILALAYRKFSWKVLVDTATETVKLSGMIFLISSLSFAFVGIFIRIGGGDVVSDLLLTTPGGAWAIFAIIMFLVFLLGFFIDWLGIVFIMVPIITPIAAKLGFDALWFGMMVCVNLQTSFMTPPFAYAIFIVKGVSPPELNITMSDIIRGVMPFVVLILVGLALCIAFPEIILWLPGKMIK